MAFGDLRGTLDSTGSSIANPETITGSVAVSIGDLVFVTFAQQTALTVGTMTDDLGHTYTATNAGTDAGAVSGRSYYLYVTTAGTLTTISVTTTASGNDHAAIAAVIEGPFDASPLDANIANSTAETASPYNCPSTGVLSQASEVVIGWGTISDAASAWSATSPNLLAGTVSPGSNARATIGYQAVAATTAVAPEFTSGASPANVVVGTSSFKAAAAAAGHPAAKRMGGVQFVGNRAPFQLWRNLLIPNRGLVYG
jgi:hypothetical protein